MKAVLNKFYGVQEIPEIENLEQIDAAGTYAVKGYALPVHVQPVTEFGASEISHRHPSAFFFVGADGRTYYGMKCGKFA